MLNTREEWLAKFATDSASLIARSIADGGEEEPAIRLSCGFAPSQGKRKVGQAAIVPPTASEDFTAEIFVSPEIDDPKQVARLIVPLLVVAHSGDYKQGSRYKQAIRMLGLDSDSLPDWIQSRVDSLGSYPHARVELPSRKVQTTRLIKVSCERDNYIARVSRLTLLNYGAPICPACLNAMEVNA